MKERPEEKVRSTDWDIRSADIPNAHAAGDGAMGRNDEKLGDEEVQDVHQDKGQEKKESEEY